MTKEEAASRITDASLRMIRERVYQHALRLLDGLAPDMIGDALEMWLGVLEKDTRSTLLQ